MTTDGIAAMYRRFAATGAAGRSTVYEEIANRISSDPRTLAFLAALPRAKRQPNLLFAAVQYLHGRLTGWDAFAAALAEPDGIADVIRRRSTQTNIPARCATLLPALAQLPQPLALVEVGASAGLCLYPDRYGYDYDRVVLPGAPTFRCVASPSTPLPDKKVEVVWRAGLDLNPLDVTDPDDRAWLDALVWPGRGAPARAAPRRRGGRRGRSAAPGPGRPAHRPARADRPAPRDATLVVFHTAVLAYVDDPADRDGSPRWSPRMPCGWRTRRRNGSPASTATRRCIPTGSSCSAATAAHVARTDPHGSRIDWL